jgi:TMEM175 potassium channel family protein
MGTSLSCGRAAAHFGAEECTFGPARTVTRLYCSPPVAVHNHDPDSLAFERLLFFSDAVFAIAITLLAIDIRLPEGHGAEDFGRRIASLTPQVVAYVITFFQLAQFWNAHHQLFRYIVQYDSALIWLNMLFLLLIAFLPVPTSAVGEVGVTSGSVTFLASCLTLTGLAELGVWLHASRGLIGKRVSAGTRRGMTIKIVIVAAVFAGSVAIAQLSPLWALLSWFLIWVGHAITDKRFH